MLSARTPLAEDDDYISHDTDMIQLLQQGIFSDIHMLSLMYAGELCYWAWAVSSDSYPPTQQVTDKQATKISEENSKKTRTKEDSLKSTSGDTSVSSSLDTSKESTAVHESSATNKDFPNMKATAVNHEPVKDICNRLFVDAEVAVDDTVAEEIDGKPAETDELSKVVDKLTGVDGKPTSISDHKLASNIDQRPKIDDKLSGEVPLKVDFSQSGHLTSGCGGEGGEGVGGASGGGVGSTSGGGVGGGEGGSEGAVSSNGTGSEENLTLYHVMLHTRGLPLIDAWKSDFDSLRHGVEMLSKYISVARGPLKNHGWSYSKAVELMVKLRKATLQRN